MSNPRNRRSFGSASRSTSIINYESKRIGGIRFTKLGRINIAFSVSRVRRARPSYLNHQKSTNPRLTQDFRNAFRADSSFITESEVKFILIRLIGWPLASLAIILLLESLGLI